MAVESDPKICKGELAMLMMKFAANKWITTTLSQMDTKMTKLVDYEFNRHQVLE